MPSPTSSAVSLRLLRTLPRGAFAKDAEALTAIFSEFDVAGNHPRAAARPRRKGQSPRAQSTRAFARNLSTRTSSANRTWDERFSTAVVTRSLIENDVSRARRAQVVDKMAAAYILEGALDRLRASGGQKRTARSRSEHFFSLVSTLLWKRELAIIVGNVLFFGVKSSFDTL